MAYIFDEPSRTFSEYLLVPGYSSTECRVENVSLQTPGGKVQEGRGIRDQDEHSSRISDHAGSFR